MSAKISEPGARTDPQPPDAAGPSHPMAFGSIAMQTWMELGTETLRFLWERQRQNLETRHALLACENLADLQAVQTRFFATALQQYAAQAGKMMDLLGSAAVRGPLASGAKRRYDDVPL